MSYIVAEFQMNNQTDVRSYEAEDIPYILFMFLGGVALLSGLYLYAQYLIKWYLRSPECLSDSRLVGQTIILTGGTSGVGRETALELSRRGARLILVCREMAAGQEVAGEIRGETMGDIQVDLCDLASLSSVRLFAAKMLETEAKVDCLVHCAAVRECPDWRTAEGYEYQLGVNYLAPFLLTWLLQPLLNRATPGPARVINVSCSQHSKAILNLQSLFEEPTNYNATYCYARSKLCLVLSSRELARRLDSTRINVYIADPGPCRSNLRRHSQSLQSSGCRLFYSLISFIIRPSLRSPRNGAQTLLYCVLEKALEEETGLYYQNCKQSPARLDEDSAYCGPELWGITTRLLEIV